MTESDNFEADARMHDAVRDATIAKALSYVPYSGFAMGAAVVTENNHVIKGSLVENVSLGLSMCAERVALFSCVANSAGKPEILALVSKRTKGALTWPCGACLQVAMELGGEDLLIVVSDGKTQESATLAQLASRLPHKP